MGERLYEPENGFCANLLSGLRSRAVWSRTSCFLTNGVGMRALRACVFCSACGRFVVVAAPLQTSTGDGMPTRPTQQMDEHHALASTNGDASTNSCSTALEVCCPRTLPWYCRGGHCRSRPSPLAASRRRSRGAGRARRWSCDEDAPQVLAAHCRRATFIGRNTVGDADHGRLVGSGRSLSRRTRPRQSCAPARPSPL